MAQAHPYNQFFTSVAAKKINVGSDTFKLMLLTNAYTPNKGTHQYQSDLTNELPSGNGYTTGGNTISGMSTAVTNTNDVQTVTVNGSPTGGTFTLTVTIGSSTLTTAAIAYNAAASAVQTALTNLGNIGTGNVTVSGSAGGPYTVTFTGSLGAENIAIMTHTDSLTGGSSPNVSIAHTTPGVGTFNISGGNVSWPSSTFIAPNAARYGVIVDTSPGTAGTNPIVGIIDFVTDQSPTNGTLSVTWDPTGIVVVTIS